MDSEIEIQETLTEAEEKFEQYRKRIGYFLGPAGFLIFYFLPFENLTYQAHALSAVIAWVVIWWVTEPVPIPVTALSGAVLCILFGIGTAKQVFSSFADPTIYLFMGSFILAKAMSVHELDKRFAYSILSIPFIQKSTFRILFAFGAVSAFASMWISNTATTAMMFPIGLGLISIIEKISDRKKPAARFATGIMLMAAYSASTGGIGTPVGTPPNLIGLAMIEKFTNTTIPFFKWMTFAVPLLLIMYIVLFLLIYLLHEPEVKTIKTSTDLIPLMKIKLGKWNREQRNTLIAFSVTVFLWIFPGIIALVYGADSNVYHIFNGAVPEASAAIIGSILLFILPVKWKEKKFTITWKQAIDIDWGTLILFGGGITLGNLMFETKLADAIGRGLLQFSGVNSIWGITLAAIFISIIVSEATSNTASANMVVPVIISICLAAGINPIPPAIGATLGASWGFMLPVSTPPNAIVYGSGLVPITKMIKTGVIFDLLGGLLIWLMLRILMPVLGFI